MSKFDFTGTVQKIQNTYKNNEKRAKQFGVGDSLVEVSTNPEDYVVMPDWWLKNYGVLGIRFGQMVEFAGDSDSGKTSISLLAIRQAQEQGYAVVYVETEGKTGEGDLIDAGINPKGVLTVHTKITEEMYDGLHDALDGIGSDYPDAKILLVLDSYGNTTSMRDANMRLTEKVQQPGGAAKVNRQGIGSIAARQVAQEIAVLVVNYNYDNYGSHGKTSAGGKALNFFTMLRIFTSRAGWYERTVAGEKVRAGADVLWKVQKNHYMKSLKDAEGNQILLPKQAKFRISNAGFTEL